MQTVGREEVLTLTTVSSRPFGCTFREICSVYEVCKRLDGKKFVQEYNRASLVSSNAGHPSVSFLANVLGHMSPLSHSGVVPLLQKFSNYHRHSTNTVYNVRNTTV